VRRLLLITLLVVSPAILHAETTVSGTIHTQTFTTANSPYIVTESLLVPPGETLTIEAGVDVLFEVGQRLTIQGAIHANGVEGDSVRFIGNQGNFGWNGIVIERADACTFRYARITGAQKSEYGKGTSTNLYGGGLKITQSPVMLEHCVISRNRVVNDCAAQWYGCGAGAYGGGISVHEGSSVALRFCTISYNSISGISGSNTGYYSPSSAGAAIYADGGSDVRLWACVLQGNTTNGHYALAHTSGATIRFDHCFIADTKSTTYNRPANVLGVGTESGKTASGTSPIFYRNCIFLRNNSLEVYASTEVAYSCFWESGLSGGEGNIIADPLIAMDDSTGIWVLDPDSPCIDAGDPDSRPDPDGTPTDIGLTNAKPHMPHVYVTPEYTIRRGETVRGIVTNLGDTSLTVMTIVVPDNFRVDTEPLPATIEPGSHMDMDVSYTGAVDVVTEAIVYTDDPAFPDRTSSWIGYVGTHLSGGTSGSWTSDLNPYEIQDTVCVPVGDTLTIKSGVNVSKGLLQVFGTIIVEPGVRFRECAIEIYGTLRAHGTEADSIVVSDGYGIRILGGESSMSYVRISDCVANEGYYPNLKGHFYNTGGGLHVSGTQIYVEMSHCVIERNTAVRTRWNGGYHFVEGHGGGVAVGGGAKVVLRDCQVSENRVVGFGSAVYVSSGAELLLERCLVSGNRYGSTYYPEKAGVLTVSYAKVEVFNCTFVDNHGTPNGKGPLFYSMGYDTISVVNSILWQLAWYNTYHGLPAVFTVHHTISQQLFPGEGNRTADPLFVDSAGGDYHLRLYSPALGAGDPAFITTVGMLPDLGAYPRIRHYPMSASESDDRPLAFALHPNMPNPFNPSTQLRFDLPASSPVRVDIYNAAGQRVQRLVDEYRSAGRHTAVWDGYDESGRPVASGVYVYRLISEHGIATRRMLLVR
jgi:hypothetical protein